MLNKLKICIKALLAVLSFILMFALLAVLFAKHFFPDATLNQMVFHALYIDAEQLSYYYLEIAGSFFVSLLIAVLVYKRIYFLLAVAALAYYVSGIPTKVSDIEVDKKISLSKQLMLSLEWSRLYEKYYTIPELKDNGIKKNVIFIFAESIEDNFSDANYWGENLIPMLSKLKGEGISFSGYFPVNGTNWTLASNVSVFCGVPIRTQLRDRLGPQTQKFLPGAVCLPDLLHQSGYYNVFVKGAYITFVGTDVFIKEHNFDEIWGRDEIIEQNYAQKEDIGLEEYGISDVKLFEFTKQKITELAETDKPFFISVQTLDTHFPHGYVQPSCEVKYGDSRDAVKCSDKMIYDFVKWCQEQDFYDNTLIFVVGDHLMMSASDIAKLSEAYPKREIYNVVLTKDIKPQSIYKPYSMFDWSAAVADKAGIIKENRLGLGVSLFGNEPTLVQQMGGYRLEEEVLKNSLKYNFLLGINN